MPEYRFDMGNSSEGEVGYVAYVEAETPELAAEELRELFQNWAEPVSEDWGTVKVLFYVNPDLITVDDAELVED